MNSVGGDKRVRVYSGEGLEARGESRERRERQRGLRGVSRHVGGASVANRRWPGAARGRQAAACLLWREVGDDWHYGPVGRTVLGQLGRQMGCR